MPSLPTILIADDNSSVRTVLGQALGRAGYQVQFSSDATLVLQWAEDGEGDLVIADVTLPDASDLTLLKRIRAARPDLPLIAIGSSQSAMTAVQMAQCGVADYLVKPFDLEHMLKAVRSALLSPALSAGDVSSGDNLPEQRLVGESAAIKNVRQMISRLKMSGLPVVITGESGTGKALLARLMHDNSARRDKPFVTVNKTVLSSAGSSDLCKSEGGDWRDCLKQATGGTLFIDEISEIPSEFQLGLLQFLHEQEAASAAGLSHAAGYTQVITATRYDLRQAVRSGLFREDLYYRLNVVPVYLPPLRERAEDIASLVAYFFARYQSENQSSELDAQALACLQGLHWPGNVRELENVVRRILTLYPDDMITRDIVEVALSETLNNTGEEINASDDNGSFSDVISGYILHYLKAEREGVPVNDLYARVISEVEKPLIQLTLAETRGNQIKAATMLGLNRNTLRKKIRELEIPVIRFPG